MNEYFLVANGVIEDYRKMKQLITSSTATIVAVDGGLRHLKEMDIVPDIIIGDMDSTPKKLLQEYDHIPVKTYPNDKDETDLELAIEEALENDAESITVIGALGGRCDHHLATLYIMSHYPDIITCETETEEVFVIKTKTVLEVEKGQSISLLPLGEPATGVRTKGLKWELNGVQINDRFLSISNQCSSDLVEISLEKGSLLCTLNKP